MGFVTSSATASQVLVAGTTLGAWATESAGKNDFAAFLLDVGTPASVEPTPVPTLSPAQSIAVSGSPLVFGEKMTQQPEQTWSASPTIAVNTDTLWSTSTPWPIAMNDPGLVITTTTLAVLIGVATLIGVLCVICGLGGAWRCYRRAKLIVDSTVLSSDAHLVAPAKLSDLPRYEEDASPSMLKEEAAVAGTTRRTLLGTTPSVQDGYANDAANTLTTRNAARGQVDGGIGDKDRHKKHPAPVTTATQGGADLEPVGKEEAMGGVAFSGESGTMPIENARRPVCGVGVTQAVIAAARKLAVTCPVPGISEAAKLIIDLVDLVQDRYSIIGAADNTIKRCRSVIHLLHIAAGVLEEVSVAVVFNVCVGPISKGYVYIYIRETLQALDYIT